MRRVWDEAFTLYGLIAEYADMPDDRSSITFYINPNAKFLFCKLFTMIAGFLVSRQT